MISSQAKTPLPPSRSHWMLERLLSVPRTLQMICSTRIACQMLSSVKGTPSSWIDGVVFMEPISSKPDSHANIGATRATFMSPNAKFESKLSFRCINTSTKFRLASSIPMHFRHCFMKESKLTLDFDQKSLIIPDNQIKQLPKVEKPVEIDLSDTKLGEGQKH
ncbi:hypothetical protein TNCV_5131311 [Trichonephila clavipes]|nr:hypothetical protein TNCV_5131311 [Trichonephila clavipes]